MTKVIFAGYECDVIRQEYRNKQIGLKLVAADSEVNRSKGVIPGEPITTATSCLESYKFSSGITAIKNYSENEGMLDVLVNAKIVEDTGRVAFSGFCSFPVVKVLI